MARFVLKNYRLVVFVQYDKEKIGDFTMIGAAKRYTLIALGLLFASSVSALPLIQNGSFEAGTGTDADGWVESGNGQRNQNNTFGLNSPFGDYYGALTSNNPGGSLAQSVVFDVAGIYEISFWLAQRGSGPANTTVTVSFGDLLPATDITITTASGVWTEYAYLLDVQTTGSRDLVFAEINASANRGPNVDNVNLSRVPVPAPLALLGIGLIAVGYRQRKLTRA